MSDKETLSKLLDAEAGLLKTHIETMVENKDQEAWDRFAEAALIGYCFGLPMEKTGTDQTIGEWRAINAAEQADKMMEQRKARMG